MMKRAISGAIRLGLRFAYSDHVAQRAFRFSIFYLATLFAALLLDHYVVTLLA